MASSPSVEQDAESAAGADYVKMHSMVMDFKDRLAKSFLEKGLVSESYKLADFKAVATETARAATCGVQRLSDDVVHVLKLVAEVICVLICRIKEQQADTIDTAPQRDVSAPVARLSSSIKKEQHIISDNVDDDDNGSHNAAISTTTTTPTPTTTTRPPNTPSTCPRSLTSDPTPTTTPTHHPVLRRSSRSSVLNRKPVAKPARRRGESQERHDKSSVVDKGLAFNTPRKEKTTTAMTTTAMTAMMMTATTATTMTMQRVVKSGEEEVTEVVGQKTGGGHEGRGSWEAGSWQRSPGGQWRCWQCGEMFGSLRAMRSHLHSKHRGTQTFQCPKCSRTFLNSRSLQNHQKTHTPVSRLRKKSTQGTSEDGKTPDPEGVGGHVVSLVRGKRRPGSDSKTSEPEGVGDYIQSLVRGEHPPKDDKKPLDPEDGVMTIGSVEHGNRPRKEEVVRCSESESHDAMAVEEGDCLKREEEDDHNNDDVIDNDITHAEQKSQRSSSSQPTGHRRSMRDDDNYDNVHAEQKGQRSSSSRPSGNYRSMRDDDHDDDVAPAEQKGQRSSSSRPSAARNCRSTQDNDGDNNDDDIAHAEEKGQRSSSSTSSGNCGSMGSMYKRTEAGFYRCSVCGQEARDRSNMRKHVLRRHAGEQRHRCAECGKGFAYPESLKFHMKVHADPNSRAFERTPQGAYCCKQCGRECRNRSNMVKHVTRKHLKAGEKPYRCSQCSAAFGYLRSLARHELVHRGERPFPCHLCHRRFFDSTSLRTHVRVHSDDRPFPCQLCGSRFRQKEGLKGHMRSHTGDKPYVCDRCGVAFAAQRSLTRHIRVHTGERPYSCDQCVAAFADWTTLHNHKLVHRHPSTTTTTTTTTTDTDTGTEGYYTANGDGATANTASESKPYQCQFCGFQYADPHALKRHLRVHTSTSKASRPSSVKKPGRGGGGGRGESECRPLHRQYRPYVCEVCGERFKHLRGYTTHRGKHLDHHDNGNTRLPLGGRITDTHPASAVLDCHDWRVSGNNNGDGNGGGAGQLRGGDFTDERATQVLNGCVLPPPSGREVRVSVFQAPLAPPPPPLSLPPSPHPHQAHPSPIRRLW